ncbi:hypothetical protein WJX74_001425 [Apatococcus lobatus]|uniref:U4/U6.U5 small nuclear ribonucleoprotein 27kDa protein domain-containing protein n=1 Tax=Apatococcus lobatus TaxID=904363 RepID=A0AAW1S1Y5_9CHLO
MPVEAQVLKQARQDCYQAKDSFYSCLDSTGKPFTAGTAPEGCQKQRSDFEAACKSSWVSHFDKLKDKDTRLIQTLHKNINTSASKGQLKGQLSGQPSAPASDSKSRRDRDHRDRDADRDRHRSRHPRERSRERERERDHARGAGHEDRPRDKERRPGHRSRSRERDQAAVDRYHGRDRGREDDRREDRKRDRGHDQDPQRLRDEPAPKAPRHRSPERPRDSRRSDGSGEREEMWNGRPSYDEGRNGGDAMDEDGALPVPVPSQVPDLNFDADITPEEMQMMAGMGIPFGFDTTQGKDLKDDKVNAGAIKVKKNRLARQYMNRRGGFNRPLPAERTGEKTQVTSTR